MSSTNRSPLSLRRLLWWAVPAGLLAGSIVGDPSLPAADAPFASVNGVSLSYGSFFDMLQDLAGREAAERLLIEEAIRQEAVRLSLDPTPEAIEARLKELVAERFDGDMVQFTGWLASEGATEESVKRRLASDIRDLSLRTQGVTVTDEELHKWYDANHEKLYDRPPLVKFRQVVTVTKEQAEDVLKKIRAGEVDFFGAAARFSVDPAAKDTGGLVGPVPEISLKEQTPALFDALSKLQVYQTTPEPVAQGDKWVILMLVERTAGKSTPYEQVVSHIRRDYLVSKAVPEDKFYPELLRKFRIDGLPSRYRAAAAAFEAPPPAPAAEGAGGRP
ncbi:MAG: peptidyl-prolyl cis-trans isomerase [Armatimonadetes bacterium]|nr:peptidyl-prolyl cis-trans isomerase [Armatimonadota bacterium]